MNLTELLLKSELPFHEITDDESVKLKTTLLQMFQDILIACDKHNLTVLLGGGSCLGAVRHKGFIPWDDDLDLNMIRVEYDKFPQALEDTFPGKYFISGPGFSEDYSLPFIKIEKNGTSLKTIYDFHDETNRISIDLFPIENIPENKLVRLFHGFYCDLYQYISLCVKLYQRRSCPVTALICSTKEGRKTISKRLFIGKIFSFMNYKQWYKIFDRVAQKYKHSVTSLTTIPTGRRHYFGEIQQIKEILPAVDCEFESIIGKINKNYDEYLKALYGNYLEIPPVEKREKHYIIVIDFGNEQ